MSTRAITNIYDNGTQICALYTHWDGYPAGYGKELAEFVNELTMTNSLQGQGTANGMGCLAAQIIAHFKTRPGNFYMVPVGQEEEYNYNIRGGNWSPEGSPTYPAGNLRFNVRGYDEQIYEGTVKGFLESLNLEAELPD